MRPIVVYWLVLLGLAAVVLFRVSQDVDALERDLASLNGEILAEHDAIRVLRAEWAYLNRPERLRHLAGHLTALEPLEPIQLVANAAAIPMPLPKPGETVSLADLALPGLANLPLPPRAPASFRGPSGSALPTSAVVTTTPPTPTTDPTPTVVAAAAFPFEPRTPAAASAATAPPASAVAAQAPPTPTTDPTPTRATTAAFSSPERRPASVTSAPASYGSPRAMAIQAANRSDDPIGALLSGVEGDGRQWR